MGGRDRSVIHTAGPRCWWRGEHQCGWEKPGLCLPTSPCSCLHCPAFCLCAQLQLIFFLFPEWPRSPLQVCSQPLGIVLAPDLQTHLVPVFSGQVAHSVFLASSASRLPGLAYRGMCVVPSLLYPPPGSSLALWGSLQNFFCCILPFKLFF